MQASSEQPIGGAVAPDGKPLLVELLDAPSLVVGDGARWALERKDAALLALLAIDGPRSRAEAAALLWPEADPAQQRNSLRQRLFRLQRAAHGRLLHAASPLRLAAGLRSDLDSAAERLALDADARCGELLGAHDYGECLQLALWVDGARARWRQRRADLLAQLASQHESRGEVAPALRYALRLAADEPLLEHAQRRVIRLHYLRGDRSAALAAYEQCRLRLREQLGVEPDRETLELARQIGSGHAARQTLPAATPITVLRPPRLVGRDAERARLTAAIAARELLLLHGEPGIGKTHLIEDAVDGRAELLAAAALAGEARVPYVLLARIAQQAHERFARAALDGWVADELARLVPGLGPAPAARLDPLRLQQAFAAALDAWSACGLAGLAVDDLHHADEASLEALLALAARPRGAPLAWLFGVRSHEMPAALQAWLAADDDSRLPALRLAVLDAGGVQALLESLALPGLDVARWAPPLLRHTGGNPLFVLETLRALLAAGTAPPTDDRLPVPAGLHLLIERRLARLSEPALRLARVAALAGTDFDADVAAHVLDVHPLGIVEPWRELDDAQMFRHGRFAHDVIAETVARALPQPIAQSLHGRLAACLEALARAPARVAPHWALAGAWQRAGESYAAAARDAQRASRRADEVALWQQAADCFDRAALPARAFDARADAVESSILVHGVQTAMALVDRLAADERTEPQRLRRLTARANACLMAGDPVGGEAAARDALDSATRLGALWPRFEAGRLLAVALAQAGRADESLAAIEPFHEPVMREGSDEQRKVFWSDYAYALRAALKMRETAAALRQAIEFAQATGDYAEQATLTSNLATVEGNFGHVERALDLAKRARVLRDPLGDVDGPASGAIDMYVGVYGGGLGRYAEALDDLERALHCFERNGQTVWSSVCTNHQATLLMQLGQYARAQQALAREPAALASTRVRRAMLAARLACALGRSGDAERRQTLELIGPGTDPYVRLLAQLDASFALPPDEAVRQCRDAEAEADALGTTAVLLRARVQRLQHALRAGAGALLDRELPDALAQALAGAQPADLYPPDAWWALHRVYLAQGETQRADAALAQAFAWLAQRALPNVPPPFRDGFLQRNATNRVLIAAAGQRLGERLPAG